MLDIVNCCENCYPVLVVYGACGDVRTNDHVYLGPSGGYPGDGVGDCLGNRCEFLPFDDGIFNGSCYQVCELQDEDAPAFDDIIDLCNQIPDEDHYMARLDALQQDAYVEAMVAKIADVCNIPESQVHFEPVCTPAEGTEVVRTGVPEEEDCPDGAMVTISENPVDFQLWIDSDYSAVTFTTSSATVSTPLDGRLFAGTDPLEFMAGLASGGSVYWGGQWYDHCYAGFMADIQISTSSNSLVVPSGQLGAIWWEGRRRSDGQRVVYDLSPSTSATGSYNPSTGMWGMTYSQAVSGGTVSVTVGGMYQP
jgi:hypothetical protein